MKNGMAMQNTILGLAGAGMLILSLGACGRSAPEAGADLLGQSSGSTATTLPVVTQPTAPPVTEPVPVTQPSYVIQQGDSLSQVAERFGVSTSALADFNGIEDVNAIKVGQTLTIPPTTAPAATDTSTSEVTSAG